VRTYQGSCRATAGFDDAFTPKHEAAPLFKAAMLPLREHTAPRAWLGRRSTLAAATAEPRLRPPPPPPRVPEPPLASTRATLVANCAAVPRPSPEQSSRRTPPSHAAEPQHRRDPDPNQAPKSNVGECLVVFPTFPGRPLHRSRPIPASRAALHAGD
jgi:hypothetical protein